MPKYLREIFKAATKYGFTIHTGPISQHLKGQMPAWHNIFSTKPRLDNLPQSQCPRSTHKIQLLEDSWLTIYTDGSCLENGTDEAKCRSGIWFGQGDPRNTALHCPGPTQSNQVGELYAIAWIAKTTDKHTPLRIKSDSKYVINGLTTYLQEWEDHGWIGINNKELFQATAAVLRLREAPTVLLWVKGHAGDIGNEEADKLVKEGANKTPPDNNDIVPNDNTILLGAKLCTMTQAKLYKGIKASKQTPFCCKAMINVERIKCSIKELTGHTPQDSAVWKSIHNKDISHNICSYLWKTIHHAYKCGEWWQQIPGYEHRADCPQCQVPESMEHILLECDSNARTIIWKLAQQMWELKGEEWPDLSWGTVLGIIISEFAHLIWKLRCERCIEYEDNADKFHSPLEIKRRWLGTMNRRLALDCTLTNSHKYGKRAINKHLVITTWSQIIKDERSLPKDWFKQSGVLVGIG
ncbi:RnaseH-domain-containing protein [Pleurotus eryngii]|uniref:ribonuclease H n=1 Tax=Pleurotus eryngii TaxID=5323 RepID=A0A9P5ZUB9_PLEER|nr:RnaseH-domain-containing protein [Pleurotus eryngii]